MYDGNVWQCEKMVAEYVPQAILELETLLGPEKLCYESGVCMPPAIKAFQDEKKKCTVCQDLATDALTYLENNKTREEIVIALHLGCSQLRELSKSVREPSSFVHLSLYWLYITINGPVSTLSTVILCGGSARRTPILNFPRTIAIFTENLDWVLKDYNRE